VGSDAIVLACVLAAIIVAVWEWVRTLIELREWYERERRRG
jgi:hypothetical protein